MWAICEFLFLYFRRLLSKTPHLHLDQYPVGPVTSAISHSSRKKKTLRKFIRHVERRVTNLQRRTIEIDLAQDSGGWRSFRDTNAAWRDSFFPGDVSAPRRTEDKLCYFFFKYFFVVHFNKIGKYVVNGVSFVASLVVRLQPRSTLPQDVCHRQVQHRPKKKCLFGRAESSITKIASRQTIRLFPREQLSTQGVNSAKGSTGVDVHNRSLGFRQ